MSYRIPDGPRDGIFGIRMMAQMKSDILGWYTQLRQEFGDIASFGMGPYRFYVFFHPEHVREVLVTQAKSFVRFPRALQVLAQWNGNSMLIAEGDAWVRQRRLVQPAFHPRQMETYAQTMVLATQELAQSWETQLGQRDFVDMDINEAMIGLTLVIICRALLDTDVTQDFHQVSKAVATLSEVAFHEMQAPIRWPKWWPSARNRRKRWGMKVLDDLIWRFVRNRRAEQKDHGDLLSMLLASVDAESDGGGLTDRQVRDEVMTLMLAGHDTTAAALNWVLYFLAKYPQIQQECRKEVQSVVAGRSPRASDAGHLKYVEATIKESMRILPPAVVMFLRQAVIDLKIGGFDVPKGSLVSVCPYVTHRDPRWFPTPEAFDPDRFLPPRVEAIPPCAYFPFGAGPRVCIGQGFAMTEMILVVATILEKFQLSLIPGSKEPTPHVHLALRPAEGLWLRIQRISHS